MHLYIFKYHYKLHLCLGHLWGLHTSFKNQLVLIARKSKKSNVSSKKGFWHLYLFIFSFSRNCLATAVIFVLDNALFLLNRTACFHCDASIGLSANNIKIATVYFTGGKTKKNNNLLRNTKKVWPMYCMTLESTKNTHNHYHILYKQWP